MKAFYENRTYIPEIPVSAIIAEDMDFVAHWHTDIEIMYVYKGCIGVGINSEYKMLSEGEISICASNDIHYYNRDNMTSTILLIIFRPTLLSSIMSFHDGVLPCSLFIDKDYLDYAGDGTETAFQIQASLKLILESIKEEMNQKEALYPLFTTMRISELFLTLFRYFPCYYTESGKKLDSSHSPDDITPMQKALIFLEGNYTQNITLEMISKEVGLSRFYFSRLFQKTTGMNFNNYLTHIRLDKAEELIKASRRPIVDIAFETGFNSIRTFNRSFRSIKGCTPQSVRCSI